MRKKETISTYLGVRQDEIATLLQISRAQWSMYESGKRDLPKNAQIKLAEILKYMDLVKANVAQNKTDKGLERIELEALLRENEYQQLKTERELATSERKLESGLNALELAGWLASQSDLKKGVSSLSKGIESRAHKDIKQNGIAYLTRLKIKQDTLKQEELLLKTALKKGA